MPLKIWNSREPKKASACPVSFHSEISDERVDVLGVVHHPAAAAAGGGAHVAGKRVDGTQAFGSLVRQDAEAE